jgi:hypothetical protein
MLRTIAFLLPKNAASHVINALRGHSPGLSEMSVKYAVSPNNGRERASGQAAEAQPPSLMPRQALGLHPQPCLTSKLVHLPHDADERGQDETHHIYRLSP